MTAASNDKHDEKSLGLPTKQQARNLDDIRAALQQWLQGRIAGAEDLRVVELKLPSGSGLANETVMLDVQWQQTGKTQKASYVVRIETPEPLFPGTTAERQYLMYAALADEPHIPVPHVMGFEADTAVLGAPFFLMKKIEGRVPADDPPFHHSGWLTELDETERASMWRDAVRVMAQLHQVDTGKLQFLNPHGNSDGLRAMLDY
ncbi:MAG: phosphotransferase, partial [Spongiibacteraceae bacterium]